MQGANQRSVWLLLFVIITPISCICPSRCQCSDQKLQVVCLNGNLQVFPIQLNPEVQHVDLSKNNIASIHYTLKFYNNLNYLDISYNQISTLGSMNFKSQQNLKFLNVSWNQIGAVSKETFVGLSALRDLNLGFNFLSDIPSQAFKDLHSLESLNLAGNQLTNLDKHIFKSMKHLKVLHLEKNQFLEIPGLALENTLGLKFLGLSQNLIASIDNDSLPVLNDLLVLLLDKNLIAEVSPNGLSKLKSLSHFDISDNNISSIPSLALSKVSNLTYLRLSGNLIETLPAVALKGLFHLKVAFLNRLEFLTHIDKRAFVDNINLENIYLDDNIGINKIPYSLFSNNPKLKHISIRNNQLTTLHSSQFPLDNLHSLRLGGNPWHCNCTIYWLWRLVNEQGSNNQNNSEAFKIDSDGIVCFHPQPLKGLLLLNVNESAFTCSLGWITTLSTITLVCFIIVIALSLLYWRFFKKKETISMRNQGISNHSLSRYGSNQKLGSQLAYRYDSLVPCRSNDRNFSGIYVSHESNNIIIRPHIVYV